MTTAAGRGIAPRHLALLTGVALLIVWVGRSVLPWNEMFPDFVCYWASGLIVASGQDVYDAELQARVQQEYGWDKATKGLGLYDSLPYFYPPWMGLACTLLVPLGFETAKVVWFFGNVELALLSGYLLGTVVAVPRWVPLVLVATFAFTLACVLLAQTSIVMLFLLVVAWRLLDRGWDRTAGAVLLGLTHKPQLSAVLLLAGFLWVVRRRRWGVVQGFFAALVLLSLASVWTAPAWPVEMGQAIRQTPTPTQYYPWIGNTWFLVLRACGLHGGLLWVLYLAVAVPFLAAVVRAAWDRTTPLGDLLSLGVLAAFFVAPYARHYDFPVLLIPVVVLLAGRLPDWAGGLLLPALVVVPYLQYFVLAHVKGHYNPSGKFLVEGTFFWIPSLLALAWFATRSRAEQTIASGSMAPVNQ
jgi:hypothetical protein